MNFLRLLLILLIAFTFKLSAMPLGLGSDYDVLVKYDLNLNGAHIHGSSAVGGNVVLTGNMTEFGNHMVTGSGPGLVVAGQVILGANGRVNGPGIANVGSLTGTQTVNSQGISGSGRMLYASQVNVGPVAPDIEDAFEDLSLLSLAMADLASTISLASVTSGDAANLQLNLSFNASSTYDVLNMSAAEFMSFKNIQVANPGSFTSSLIINVDLTDYSGDAITQNRNGSDAAASHILWNFYGSSSLLISNQFLGTVFAPDLAVTHLNNDFKGQVIASSFTKFGGQVHDHRYEGDVPPVQVPDDGTTLMLLLWVVALAVFAHRMLRCRAA